MTRNGKKRMEEILDKKKKGGFVWTTLVEDITMTGMPEPYRSMKPLDFYRHVGCDIFQFSPMRISTKSFLNLSLY
jgi:hypothetical protein